MATKKTAAKTAKPKEEPFVRCGDCDAKLPPETTVCPKCGYGIA